MPKTNDGPHGNESALALRAEGFTRSWDARGLTSLARQIAPSGRRGIYVLAFATGEWYVGQAGDVTSRYRQHRADHADLERVYFKRAPKRDLDAEERRLIETLEQEWRWPLRNIVHASLLYGDAELHEIVPEAALDRWSSAAGVVLDDAAPAPMVDLRRKKREIVSQLRAHPLGADAIRVLGAYLPAAVPAPRSTEGRFWSVSCFPSGAGGYVLLRVNVNWQEVCTLYEERAELYCSLHVAETPLETHGRALRLRHPDAMLLPHRYRPGGSDQTRYVVPEAGAIERFLQEERVRLAARVLNRRLMEKGPVNASTAKTHTPQVVDWALGGISDL